MIRVTLPLSSDAASGDMPRLTLRQVRWLRFLLVGGGASVCQMLLLWQLTRLGIAALPANALAFLIAAQVNFVLSLRFTWADRLSARTLLHQWGVFHLSIASTAILNMVVFALARTIEPTGIAAAAGTATAALANYMLGDLLVFREKRTAGLQETSCPAA